MVHNATAQQLKASWATGCHAYAEGIDPSYGYVPSKAAGAVFVMLFALSAIVHLIQMCWKRNWWGTVFILGCISECLGWAGRLWSAECPYNKTAFLIQISTLIFAPAFYTAGIYIILGRFITLLGQDSSILSPALYLWIFCSCDIVSLVVQAAGGGIASAASSKVNDNTKPGTNVMVAGIVFQMASITVFVVCAAEFLRRVMARPHQRQWLKTNVMPLMFAMIFSVVCIYIRSIYRTIELLQGWTGYLITHEPYFLGLDGSLMVAAVAVFNFIHPGWFLPDPKKNSAPPVGYDEGMDGSKYSMGLGSENSIVKPKMAQVV